jgi:hypothetical protein
MKIPMRKRGRTSGILTFSNRKERRYPENTTPPMNIMARASSIDSLQYITLLEKMGTLREVCVATLLSKWISEQWPERMNLYGQFFFFSY